MALVTREIPREEWFSYFDDFSRDVPQVIAHVEVIGDEVGAQIEAERPRLTGITYDYKDDILVIGLDAQRDLPEDLEHIVYQPKKIMVAEGDGETIVYDIEDAEQNKTLLRLEPVG
ncbi:MAG: DUF5335 family protein [Solirubrobacteraceae bacterium]